MAPAMIMSVFLLGFSLCTTSFALKDPKEADCDFQQDMCGWTNVHGMDNFDWTRHRGATNSPNTGPTSDHTTGNKKKGYYLYTEARKRKLGHKAILRSTAMDGSSTTTCFKFWYHMHGAGINQLKVSVEIMGGAKTVLWQLKGQQENKWRRAFVPIPPSTGTFSILMEGIAGGKYADEIAIDDLRYFDQTCELRPENSISIDCDFQQDLCRWMDVEGSDKFNWTRHKGATPSLITGPPKDHTTKTKNGYYLYIETNDRRKGDNAILKSTAISGSSRQTCFKFWYHMYGANINQLTVLMETTDGAKELLWQLRGQNLKCICWRNAFVPIPPSNGTFSILIEALAGRDFKSDIGIDDLMYFDYACKIRPAQPTPTVPPTTKPPFTGPTPPLPTLAPGTCGISPIPPRRVIGGKDAVIGAWPWQAAIWTEYGLYLCGGSLINNQWIVTAAHCVHRPTDPTYYRVVLGDHNRAYPDGERTFTVSKLFEHPLYGDTIYNNDVALIKLSRPVIITRRISPVCLPTKSEVVAVGTNCYITGWGKMRHPGSSVNILQQALMPIRGKQECNERLAKSPNGGRLNITDQMVCAGYTQRSTKVSGCHGDSGGPLVCQKSTGEFQLHGAVSWGSPRCNVQERFSVFARITAVIDWIDQTVAEN